MGPVFGFGGSHAKYRVMGPTLDHLEVMELQVALQKKVYIVTEHSIRLAV